MTTHATGSFQVTLAPQPLALEDTAGGLPRARMSIDKRFHGDLEGTSRGEMLSVMDQAVGSGGYVAIEKVEGALHGRRGTFVLQHSATMTRGTPRLEIAVVPASATGELAGLTGRMALDITDGVHRYDFEYALPAPA